MLQDLRFGLRTLSKNPGFTAVAVIALALGIGANATVFSLVNAILFKNLPFADSDRVVYIGGENVKGSHGEGPMSLPDYEDLRGQVRSFVGIAAAQRDRVNVSGDANAPSSLNVTQITANGLTVLGQRPILGRDFTADDEKPGATPVVMLTHSVWDSRYGKDRAIVGRTIRMNGVPTTVIGVAAEGLAVPVETQVWVPYIAASKERNRGNRNLTVFGLLAPGVSREAAQAELTGIGARLASQYPQTNRDIRFVARSFTEQNVHGPIKTVFLALLGAVGFVLLIACANVANLLLSRAVGRAREISIRAALGAGRWRVVRQLLVESLLLSIAGGLVG